MGQAVLQAENDSTVHRLHVAFELSAAKWRLAFTDGKRVRQVTVEAGALAAITAEVEKARRHFKLAASAQVVSVYEAGRDGFWLDRWLESVGVKNVVVEPASIQVDRRARRAKTDRLDVEALLRMLVRFSGGERDVWRVVRVPGEEAEDLRRRSRERQRLKQEEVQHRNRIRGLLNLHGCRVTLGKGFREGLSAIRLWNGKPLPARAQAEVLRELDRLDLILGQLAQLEGEHRKQVTPPKPPKSKTSTTKGRQPAKPLKEAEGAPVALHPSDLKIRRLMELRGVGLVSATVLVDELFGWRTFRNRREVGAIAGLQGTPYQSGGPGREQGISKAGNPRVRTTMIELAWGWLHWQPGSALAKRFYGYVGKSDAKTKSRFRKVAIVALARQLLVALWHYLEHGVLPEGAVWRSAAA